MSQLAETNLNWARHMVWAFDEDGHGRDNSTSPTQRGMIAVDAKKWIEGKDPEQHQANMDAIYPKRP